MPVYPFARSTARVSWSASHSQLDRAVCLEVRVVHDPVGVVRVLARREVQEVVLGPFRSELGPPLQAETREVDQRHVLTFGELPHGVGVLAVRRADRARVVEPSALHRRHEDRVCALLPCSVDVEVEVLLVGRVRGGAPVVGLRVVVAEGDEKVVTGLDLLEEVVEQTGLDEALGAGTRPGVVGHLDVLRKELAERLAPTGPGCLVSRVGRRCGVARDEHGDLVVGCRGCLRRKQGDGRQSGHRQKTQSVTHETPIWCVSAFT